MAHARVPLAHRSLAQYAQDSNTCLRKGQRAQHDDNATADAEHKWLAAREHGHGGKKKGRTHSGSPKHARSVPQENLMQAACTMQS